MMKLAVLHSQLATERKENRRRLCDDRVVPQCVLFATYIEKVHPLLFFSMRISPLITVHVVIRMMHEVGPAVDEDGTIPTTTGHNRKTTTETPSQAAVSIPLQSYCTVVSTTSTSSISSI